MFFRKLKELIKKIFVEGDQVKGGLMSYVYKKFEVENQNAYNFELMREGYQN